MKPGNKVPRSRKEAASFRRIEKARAKRQLRKVEFLRKLAKRRGVQMSAAPCQTGFLQIVDAVTRVAGGYFYTSKACTGCRPGSEFFRRAVKGAKLVQVPDKVLGCHKLQNEVLYTETPIKENDIIVAQKPA